MHSALYHFTSLLDFKQHMLDHLTGFLTHRFCGTVQVSSPTYFSLLSSSSTYCIPTTSTNQTRISTNPSGEMLRWAGSLAASPCNLAPACWLFRTFWCHCVTARASNDLMGPASQLEVTVRKQSVYYICVCVCKTMKKYRYTVHLSLSPKILSIKSTHMCIRNIFHCKQYSSHKSDSVTWATNNYTRNLYRI